MVLGFTPAAIGVVEGVGLVPIVGLDLAVPQNLAHHKPPARQRKHLARQLAVVCEHVGLHSSWVLSAAHPLLLDDTGLQTAEVRLKRDRSAVADQPGRLLLGQAHVEDQHPPRTALVAPGLGLAARTLGARPPAAVAAPRDVASKPLPTTCTRSWNDGGAPASGGSSGCGITPRMRETKSGSSAGSCAAVGGREGRRAGRRQETAMADMCALSAPPPHTQPCCQVVVGKSV